MRKLATGLLALASAACTAAPSGPSQDDVQAAWQSSAVVGNLCRQFVHFQDPQIAGTTQNDNQAEVLVRSTGDWQDVRVAGLDNPRDPGFMMGPCAGFHPGTMGRPVEVRMVFTKYDTGWRFENLR